MGWTIHIGHLTEQSKKDSCCCKPTSIHGTGSYVGFPTMFGDDMNAQEVKIFGCS